MRIRTLAFLVALALGSALSSGIGAQTIRIDGASAGSAIGKIAAEEFRKARKGAPYFTAGISGSDGGFSKLCGNEIDLANTARPIFNEELAACQKAAVEFVELPIALDAVTVVVNARNGFVQDLTLSELRAMWEEAAQGKIVRWSQINADFPDAPLKLLGPDSRYEHASIFTEAVLGHGRSARRDYMTSVDDNILVQGVARDVHALSYVSHATFLDNRGKLKEVPITSGTPTAGAGHSRDPRATGAGAPLARPLFLYVNVKSLEKPYVREFVAFTLLNGGRIVKAARYQPLSGGAYRLGLAHVKNNIKGSAWDGSVPTRVTPMEVEKRLAAL